jgi:hypothetical protein
MNVNAVLDAVGARLAGIAGLRVYDYPAEKIEPPAAVVGLPEVILYDRTYQRGADATTIPVFVMVSKVSDREARDRISAYTVSVKAALDGTLGGVVDDAWVRDATPQMIRVGDIEYMGCTFRVEVTT